MSIEERRQKEKEQRRRTILAAAERLFAGDGFHNTTIEQVAADIDLSKGTIYLYFQSKEDLFFSILEEKIDNYTHHLKERLAQAENLKCAVSITVSEQFKFLTENHHFFRLAMSESTKFEQKPSHEMRLNFIAKQVQFTALLEKVFSTHMKKQAISGFKPKSLALSVNGAINAHMMNWLITGSKTNLEKVKADILHILLHGCAGQTNEE